MSTPSSRDSSSASISNQELCDRLSLLFASVLPGEEFVPEAEWAGLGLTVAEVGARVRRIADEAAFRASSSCP